MPISKRRRNLILFTGAVCAALAVAPQTGALVRRQARIATEAASPAAFFRAASLHTREDHPDPKGKADVFRRELRAAAGQLPYDVEVQIAGAAGGNDDYVAETERVRALATRFPRSAVVYATELRLRALRRTHLSRRTLPFVARAEREKAVIEARRLPSSPRGVSTEGDFEMEQAAEETARWNRIPKAERAQSLARYADAARAGARLEPQNAYFPLMYAAALFDHERDAEAVAQVMQASRLPVYDDHVADVIAGRWRLANQAERGEAGAITRNFITMTEWTPQNTNFRAVFKLCIVQAWQAEKSGKVGEGIALRQAVARIGDLLRAAPGGLSSGDSSIVDEAASQSYATLLGSQDAEERKAAHTRYVAYLTRHRRAGEARWYEKAARASEASREMEPHHCFVESERMYPIYLILSGYAFGYPLLWQAALLLLTGIAASGALRLVSARKPSPWVRGAAAAFAASPALVWSVALASAYGFGKDWGPARAVFALSRPYDGFATRTVREFSGFGVWDGLYDPHVGAIYVITGLSVAPLVLLLVVLPLLSRRAGVAPSLGLLRALRGLAVPLACVSLLLYAGLSVAVARREAAVICDLEAINRDEKRFVARQEGKTWPARTPPLTRP